MSNTFPLRILLHAIEGDLLKKPGDQDYKRKKNIHLANTE